MNDRRRDDQIDEEGRIHQLAGLRRSEPNATDWQWLDTLSTSDFNSDFMDAVEERVEDQERPQLEDLFD